MMPENIETLPVIDQLRIQTLDSHKKLENLPVSISITSPSITKAQYADYLLLMSDVIWSTEQFIFPIVATVIPDLENRRKLPWITADLHHLDAGKSTFTNVFSSDVHALPFALGILYVVEGSTLGGRYIIKNIASVLSFDENKGATYFAGYGNKTGMLWKNFLNEFTAFEQQNDCSTQMIAGAEFAFNQIHNHLANPVNYGN